MEQTKLMRSKFSKYLIKIRELKVEGIHKKVLFTLVALLLSRIFYVVDTTQVPLLLFFPLLLYATLLGFDYIILGIIGIILGGFSISSNVVLYYCLAIACFLTLSNLLKFLPFQFKYNQAISLFFSDFIFRIIYHATNPNLSINMTILSLSMLILLLSYFAIKVFDTRKVGNKECYPLVLLLFIGVVTSLSIVGLPNINLNNINFDYKLFFLFLLIFTFSKIVGSLIGTSFSLVSIILFYILSTPRMDQPHLILMLVSLSFAALLSDQGKTIVGLGYFIIVFFMSYILNIDILNDPALLMQYILPYAIYLAIPFYLIKLDGKIPNPELMIKLQQKQFNSIQMELSRKIKNISTLFNEVSNQLKDNEDIKSSRKEVELIYRSLCINCPKSKICYQSDVYKLIPLMQVGIEGNYTMEEERYIRTNCSKPQHFINLIKEHKERFVNQIKYYQEYNLVKQMVYFQLDGLSRVLNDYASEIQNVNYLSNDQLEEKIRITLEMLQIDVIYVKIVKDYLSHPLLEMAINVSDESQFQDVIETLEEKINCNIEITHIRKNNFNNYYSLMGIIKPLYQLSYGEGQLAKSNDVCGDSIIHFNYKNKCVLAISDGMGVGEEARRESDATLKLLKKMLETDMDDNQAIEIINTLLKLKNRIDTYATLDLVTFDRTNAKIRFIKNGAPGSYLIRDNECKTIDSYSLPVGIINDIKSYDLTLDAKVDDLIVLVSDGIVELLGDSLQSLLIKYKNLHPQTIVKNIINRCHGMSYQDDISIVVARVEKSLL